MSAISAVFDEAAWLLRDCGVDRYRVNANRHAAASARTHNR